MNTGRRYIPTCVEDAHRFIDQVNVPVVIEYGTVTEPNGLIPDAGNTGDQPGYCCSIVREFLNHVSRYKPITVDHSLRCDEELQ